MNLRNLLLILVLIGPGLMAAPTNENGVFIRNDIEYGKAGGQSLLMNIYVPSATFRRPRAGIMEVHGGGWEGGDRNSQMDVDYCKLLAREGFFVFSIDYRLVKRPHDGRPAENCFPAALDDCQRAVRWVRFHAKNFGVDRKRIGAIGGSAGGNLVSLLGTKDTRDNSDPALARFSSRVQAVVDIAGPADLTKPFPTQEFAGISVQKMVDNFTCGGDVRLKREASPIFAIDRHTPPFLILQGGADTLVPVEQARMFNAALKKAGRDVTYMEIPGEWHVFLKPENQAAAARKIVDFFHRTLDKK